MHKDHCVDIHRYCAKPWAAATVPVSRPVISNVKTASVGSVVGSLQERWGGSLYQGVKWWDEE